MEEEDQAKMLEVELLATTENSPFVATRGQATTDDVIEELFRQRNWKYTLLLMSLMLTWCSTPTVTYLTSFAGL